MKLPVIESRIITDITAAGSVGSGAVYWLATINEYLQFISLAISICLGVYALWRIKKNVK
jgi:hypothetical protein